jgi:hypothetical protein
MLDLSTAFPLFYQQKGANFAGPTVLIRASIPPGNRKRKSPAQDRRAFAFS